MGKKGYQGESARDRATNIMDKFIQRNDRKNEQQEIKPIRRKDPNVLMELWPLQDQIEYWETMSQSERFDRKYPHYSMWHNEVKSKSGMYPITFTDVTLPNKKRLQELFNNKVRPRQAVTQLRNEGILH
jgi:hypothetical protein